MLLIVSIVLEGDQSPVKIGSRASGFSLMSLDARSVRLSDLKGSVVVLDFWATWCPPCRESLPNLNRLSNDASLAARGLKVLAVNEQEPVSDVKAFMASSHFSFPVLLDSDGLVQQSYGSDSLPTTIVVGRDGSVKYGVEGYDEQSGESQLNDAIQKALSEPAS